jgi:outer membrane protein OmpA-like peptidoglycan-associated protein
MTMTQNAFENRFSHGARRLLGGVLLMALLAGTACSTDNTEEQEAAEYPNVNSVPDKPETVAALTEAEEIEEGLRADRDNARYTDEALRADTSLQPALPKPEKPLVEETETVTEEVQVTEQATTETVTETVTEKVEEQAEEAAPAVAAAAQEKVTETPLPAPSVIEAPADPTPEPAPVREQVITGETVQKPEVTSVFERQLAAQNATRLPDGMGSDGSGTATANSSAPDNSAAGAASSSSATSSNGSVTLTPPSNDGGRVIPNYAASDGSRPIETIYFGQGSHRISASDRATLDRIARTQQAAGGTLKVVGHASSRTREMSEARHMIVNFSVSQQRAAAVAEYLIKAGVQPSDLLVESVSDTQPVIAEPMPSAEAKNRRVEIFLLN